MTPDDWKRRFIRRVMDRAACSEEVARETFEGGEYTPEEMKMWCPEELADEEVSQWCDDEGIDDE